MADLRLSGMGGIPFGDSASRPSNAATGQPYFNGEVGRLELYTASSGWQNIVQETPGISSASGHYYESENTGTFIISGTNFVSGGIAYAIGTDGSTYEADTSTYNSIVQMTATWTNLSASLEPYDIKIVNPSNLFGLLPDAIYINQTPTWNTSTGSLGTFSSGSAISTSVSATDPESGTLTYAIASGSLPSNLSLNTSSGAITGTPPASGSSSTYNFTISASDGNNTSSRAFSITLSGVAEVQYLVIAGGGGGAGGIGGSGVGGGGGAGGYRSSVTGENTGGGLPAESKFIATFGTPYTVTIGNGGNGAAGNGLPTNGQNSVFATVTSLGGGFGGQPSADAARSVGSGGSGGGGGQSQNGPGIGTSGQGYNGGWPNGANSAGGGGGGGGQGADGTTGTGGVGVASSINGTSVYRAGGGGGGRHVAQGGQAAGGNGGGGASGVTNGNGQAGTANTGGGGGGGGESGGTFSGGNGGSGVVILKYPNSFTPIISGGLTSSTSTAVAGYNVTTFTAGSGTVTF